MAITTLPRIPPEFGDSRLVNQLNMIIDEIEHTINGNIDSKNTREIGGWRVGLKELISKDKDVGMSTVDTTGDDVRFFAGPNGDAWFYYVTKSGKLYANDAFITGLITGSTIIGGVIKTAETGARIELEDGVLKGYSEDNNLHGLVFSPTPVSNFFDLFMYHDGAKILEFIDNAVSVTMRGASDSIGMILGGTKPTFGAGAWSFTGNATFDNDVNGKISEAYFADHAATASAADELSPSGEIAWAQVLKGGSNVADLETKNLSSLDQNASYRTVTDTEKATWNGKATIVSGDNKVQSGTAGPFTLAANAGTNVTITFPANFATAFWVLTCEFVAPSSGTSRGLSKQIASRAVGSAGLNIDNTGASLDVYLDWIAIGP